MVKYSGRVGPPHQSDLNELSLGSEVELFCVLFKAVEELGLF